MKIWRTQSSTARFVNIKKFRKNEGADPWSDLKNKYQEFEFNALFYWQPVQVNEYLDDVQAFLGKSDDSCGSILSEFQTMKLMMRDSID